MAPKPYEFVWFDNIQGPTPCELTGCGDIRGTKPYDQRDPEVVVWPSGFLEAWGTEAKRPRIFRPSNFSFLENVWFFCLGAPGL